MKNIFLWEEAWKEFFYENLSKEAISTEKLETIFKYFHLSATKLGDGETFEFTPKTPFTPYLDDEYNTIEDDFTERISLAPSIKKAIEAIEYADASNMYVYAGDVKNDPTDDLETINLVKTFPQCPSAGNVRYGTDFNMIDWLEEIIKNENIPNHEKEKIKNMIDNSRTKPIKPKDLPNGIKKAFTACVPDANETNEYWSTFPVELLFVGKMKNGKIQLSNSAKKFLTAK